VMVRSIRFGLGTVLFLTGGVLMGSVSAQLCSAPLAGSTDGCGPPAWLVVPKPVLGISFVILGLIIMSRAGRRTDLKEERVYGNMD
jgi:hypothetical protein